MKTYMTGWKVGDVTLFVKGNGTQGSMVKSRMFPVKHLEKLAVKELVASAVVEVNDPSSSARGGAGELGSAK